MKILYSPQRNDKSLSYLHDGDILKVTFDNQVTETFDFTDFPDGVAKNIIAETLPVNPILSAKRANGELEVKVLRWYTESEKSLFEVINDG